MCAVAAAAGRQTGVVVSKSCRQRAEQEKRQEQNGNAAPHMELSVQEPVVGWGWRGKQRRPSSIIEATRGMQ